MARLYIDYTGLVRKWRVWMAAGAVQILDPGPDPDPPAASLDQGGCYNNSDCDPAHDEAQVARKH